MNAIRVTCFTAILAVIPLACGPTDPSGKAGSEKVELLTVSYEGLNAAVNEQKGKVVVIDVWFRGCVPCVKKFPHLVQMHRTFASQGLVCISVNALDTGEKDFPKVLSFLQDKGATFPNFILKDDKPSPELAEKFPTEPTPVIVMFNRQGKRVKVLEDERDLEDANVEAEVKKLLAQK